MTMLTCSCGKILVPLWTYAKLICPAGCLDKPPARTRYFIPGIPADEINRNSGHWEIWSEKRAAALKPPFNGTWVYQQSGPALQPTTDPDIFSSHTPARTVWELAPSPEARKRWFLSNVGSLSINSGRAWVVWETDRHPAFGDTYAGSWVYHVDGPEPTLRRNLPYGPEYDSQKTTRWELAAAP